MFTLVRHSFATLIDKQLSRKATLLMFQDVLLFELFQRTLPLILFYFHLNQLSNFPTKTYRSENMLFSGHLSSQSACAMSWKQAQPYYNNCAQAFSFDVCDCMRQHAQTYLRMLFVARIKSHIQLKRSCSIRYSSFNPSFLFTSAIFE